MAFTLSAEFDTIGSAFVTADLANRTANESFATGQNEFPDLSLTYEHGTGNNQANAYYVTSGTLTTGTDTEIDLSGTLTDDLGNAITLTKVKEILIAIDDPDGTKRLEVGPDVASSGNGFIGPWMSSTSSSRIYHHQRFSDPYAGWTVTPGTEDKLGIANSSGVSVTYHVVIIGLD